MIETVCMVTVMAFGYSSNSWVETSFNANKMEIIEPMGFRVCPKGSNSFIYKVGCMKEKPGELSVKINKECRHGK